MNTLTINQLSKTYPNGTTAMRAISLEVTNGMFGLLGPNGAGKSTLMRTIAGLQLPDAGGSIRFNGTDLLADSGFIKKQLGYLPQDFGVYPKLSAFDLLNHIAVLKGLLNKTERKKQILALLDKTNLYDFRNKEVHTFSGGMKQRFGVAQALLGNPQLVLVDEPTAGLDPEERNRFNNLLSEISEQIIVILSTHIVEDVRNLCPQMAIIDQGCLRALGAPRQFIHALEGKIWFKVIERSALESYRQNYQVVSSQLNSGKLHLHVFADENPQNGFVSQQPDLEDVYFTKLLGLH
jgi:ABC-2 type transport system ATP-binding protein